jgi:ribosomal protein S18 acetylase RimI-like enzyme
MKVQLERIQTTSHRHYCDILKLYLASFPKEERRDPDSLAAVLLGPNMHFYSVIAGEQLSGMVVYWKFNSYLYIEHLAVMPEKRGLGIGSLVLKMLQEMKYPVLLEVEMPYDAVSQRRIEFYSRAGFHQLPVIYFQPPYREGEELLPMMLFSDISAWAPEILDLCIAEFQFHVYFKGNTEHP